MVIRNFGVSLGLCLKITSLLTSSSFGAVGLIGDFNGGSLGTWTVNDILGGSGVLGWDVNTNIVDGADIRGNFTTGDTGAAHVDSDAIGVSAAGPYNIALESPIFVSGSGETLVFYHMFRSLDTTDFGHVEVTTDGTTWDNLTTFANTEGTIPSFPYSADSAGGSQVMLDLTGFESATTQVRFRYEGDSWDWWWQVDNVSVIPEPGSVVLLLSSLPFHFARRRWSHSSRS